MISRPSWQRRELGPRRCPGVAGAISRGDILDTLRVRVLGAGNVLVQDGEGTLEIAALQRLDDQAMFGIGAASMSRPDREMGAQRRDLANDEIMGVFQIGVAAKAEELRVVARVEPQVLADIMPSAGLGHLLHDVAQGRDERLAVALERKAQRCGFERHPQLAELDDFLRAHGKDECALLWDNGDEPLDAQLRQRLADGRLANAERGGPRTL